LSSVKKTNTLEINSNFHGLKNETEKIEKRNDKKIKGQETKRKNWETKRNEMKRNEMKPNETKRKKKTLIFFKFRYMCTQGTLAAASSQSSHFDNEVEAYMACLWWNMFNSQLSPVRWKPRVITTWFKHLGILVTVAVHSIGSDGKHLVHHFGTPSECGTALFECEVHLFSTSRKNWRDFESDIVFLKANQVNFLILLENITELFSQLRH
jgi:hypothetical protein